MNDDGKRTYSMDVLMPIICEQIERGEVCSLPVKGWSMHPFLSSERDKVFLSKVDLKNVRVGDIIMFRRLNGMYVMHRVSHIEGDFFNFIGDSQFIEEKNIHGNQLLAYVPKVIRKGKTISCERGFWRLNMVIYMHLRIRLPKLTKILLKLLYRFKSIFSV